MRQMSCRKMIRVISELMKVKMMIVKKTVPLLGSMIVEINVVAKDNEPKGIRLRGQRQNI